MLEKSLISRVLDEALQKGSDFAEIYYEEKQLNNIFCEDNRIEKINSGRERGVGIRTVKDGNTAYVYTSDLSLEGLCKAAAVANHVADAQVRNMDREITLSVKKPLFDIEYKRLPEQLSIDEKIEHVLAANKRTREFAPEIRQVTVAAGDMHRNIQIANSNGDLVEEEQVRVRLIVNAIASRQGMVQTGYESAGAVAGWELLDKINFAELGEKAARLAVETLSAKPAPAGRMPVVIAAEAGGTMVHEACGHGLEADLVQKGLSVYRNQLGKMVAAPGVSVIDDSTLPGRYGSYRFDDEGNHGQRQVLIDNGELKAYLYDYLTAAKEGKDFSANGRRESYQHKPIPRMSNTFIAPGQDDPAAILKDTKYGLLVRKMGGGQVNTTNGDFVFDVQEAYIISDGELKYPVRGATLIGNGPQVLGDIDMIGNDLGFSLGTCGKDGQGVPVADAQPTMRIKQITVGGTAVEDGPHLKRIRRK